ncbi:MAG: hypothetical protein V4615_09130 [Bacteroidota bacterium]
MSVEFPEKTPLGADIQVNAKQWVLNYTWHKGKSVSGSTLGNTPIDFDYFIVRTGEQSWKYYLPLKMNFVNRLAFETFNVFIVNGCYEDALYSIDFLSGIMEAALNRHRKQLEIYARKHNISNLPPKGVFELRMAEHAREIFLDAFARRKDPDPNELKIVWTHDPNNEYHQFVFETTFSILDKLLNHPDFDYDHNRLKLIKFGGGAYLMYLKHKCLGTWEDEDDKFTLRDMVFLSLYVEMCLQCAAGQIWNRLHPLLKAEGFSEEDYLDFLKWGKNFFVSARDSIQQKIQVENYHTIPLWDDIFD